MGDRPPLSTAASKTLTPFVRTLLFIRYPAFDYDVLIYVVLWWKAGFQADRPRRNCGTEAAAADDREEGGISTEEDRRGNQESQGERGVEQGWCVDDYSFAWSL